MANEVTTIQTRLPIPQREGIEAGYWKVLCETAFPLAKSTEAIVMALDYCKARKLDPLKKMVHIVPMWNSALGKYVETVWPGIAEVQTTAARTGKYAGMDEPRFGNEVTRTFKGKKSDKDVGEATITLTFPEWCSVTVYRIVDGQKCAFTEPVYWLEAYARTSKNSELPNDQWAKRPRGMIIKVAKAFSLRAAFPEEADYTSDEMAGRSLDDYETTIEGHAIPQEPVEARSVWKTATLRNTWFKSVVDSFESAKSLQELKVAASGHKAKFDEMVANGNENDLLAVDELRKRYVQIQARLEEEAEIDQTNYLDEDFERAMARDEGRGGNSPTEVVTASAAPSKAWMELAAMPEGGKAETETKAQAAIDAITNGELTRQEAIEAVGGEAFYAKLGQFRLGAYKQKIMEA